MKYTRPELFEFYTKHQDAIEARTSRFCRDQATIGDAQSEALLDLAKSLPENRGEPAGIALICRATENKVKKIRRKSTRMTLECDMEAPLERLPDACPSVDATSSPDGSAEFEQLLEMAPDLRWTLTKGQRKALRRHLRGQRANPNALSGARGKVFEAIKVWCEENTFPRHGLNHTGRLPP